MLKLSIVVRKHNKKDGSNFYKATAKGKYIPLVEVQDDVFYTIKLHTPKDEKGVSEVRRIPEKAGFYELAIPSRKDIWLDQREEMLGKNIVHVRCSKVLFVEALPVRELENK